MVKRKKREGKDTKKDRFFKNLAIKRHVKLTTKTCFSKASQEKPESVKDQVIGEMSPADLKIFLKKKLEDKGLPLSVLDDLERESISGEIFLDLSEEALKEILPSANFGVRHTLITIIQSEKKVVLATPEKPVVQEYFRSFDSPVKKTDKYVKGRCVDITVNRRGKKLESIRNFHPLQDQSKDNALEYIGCEVVQFASACLNERRNGTIYFGIASEECGYCQAGEIIGINLPKEEVEAEISQFLEESFHKNIKTVIDNTVRSAKFVPVIDPRKETNANLFVIEIDVVPSLSVVESSTVWTYLKWLSNVLKKKHKCKMILFKFSDEGFPVVEDSDDLDVYHERDQKRSINQRKKEEDSKSPIDIPDLKRKLLNLLTGGAPMIEDDVFPFLVTSPLDDHMDKKFLDANTVFIKDLHPEIVLDFDPKGSSKGIYANVNSEQDGLLRVLTTDNFDENKSTKEERKTLTDSLSNDRNISWLFCDGYEEMDLRHMSQTEWNRERRPSFVEALRFYIDSCGGKDRIIVLFCLFSKNYETMLQACDEVLGMLPDQWIMLAESEQIACEWQDQILSRNRVERKDMIDRCVIGMPWQHVNGTIQSVVIPPDASQCSLICSTGALVEVRKKKLNDWSDLDVLSASNPDLDDGDSDKKKKEMEEGFYKGEQVDWLNFFFNDQVLERSIHHELMKVVKEALEGKGKDEDQKVKTVLLFHQPGAGGTTSAKQVLWELRGEYRCCVVRQITDQTCEQLVEVRCYEEQNPRKPLLVFMDNEDEEKAMQLRGALEGKARLISRETDDTVHVFCTLIMCMRRATLPKQLTYRQIALRQELTRLELEWFRKKNDSLTSLYNQDKANVNPKFLISFNILRENFNQDYVRKVVKEFSCDITDEKEVKLLKIVSLLNAYDPDFKAIRVSCLDRLLQKPVLSHREFTQQGFLLRRKNWEAMLSQGVKVLLNLSASGHKGGKPKQSVRVFNKLIASEIFMAMKERLEEKESEVMSWLLQSRLFESSSWDSNHLQAIINCVMKKREFKENGRQYKFSKFILAVQDQEGSEVAVSVLQQLFDLNQDPFTAQLIARFYIDVKNWLKAREFADIATSMLPSNSFLWDTYGQVFKSQLVDKISQEKALDGDGFKDAEIHELIQLAQKCLHHFKEEQSKSEIEVTKLGEINFAGYFGELRAILVLLSALRLSPSFQRGDDLHHFLVFQEFNPPHLNFICEEDRRFLKNLQQGVKAAMRRLDEELLQMKGSVSLNFAGQSFDMNRDTLVHLKVNLDEYFGESKDAIPKGLRGKDKCEYRWRRARNLGGTSLNLQLRTVRNGKEGEQNILKVYELMYENIQELKTPDYLRTILDSITTLIVSKICLRDLTYENILTWSRNLYDIDKTLSVKNDRSYLESYLYLGLYHFPTEERQVYNLCPVYDLQKAFRKWQDAFKKNYPKHNQEEMVRMRKETTLFFLGNGLPPRDFVNQESLSMMDCCHSISEKWNLLGVREILRLLKGVLKYGGDIVIYTVVTRDGNKLQLEIPTAYRVRKQDLWQKKVYFYLGFSFKGPKAYGMSAEELGTKPEEPERVESAVFMSSSKGVRQTETLAKRIDAVRSANEKVRGGNAQGRLKEALDKQKHDLSSYMQEVLGLED
ncbi:sterile alpha motif domain-containing protein 9 [Aplysia californica]|uniref:Sterile alpha motif domain-containing protein 9 n=1 Tax=Aplysia californica TaxID=6500 RepID=A0ABM0JUW7_APLCA|nr:sterile alpha motif domain-containing protein 9 [Aplysia californica]